MKYTYQKKMPLVSMIVISALFALFNYYTTTHSTVMGRDRINYVANFIGYRPSPSKGLTFLMHMTHRFGGSIELLFYFTTFSCVFITLLAYRLSKKSTPYVFYLMCITQYFLTTLTALKQCYASAFAVLFFVLILEHDTKKSRIASLVCAILACWFHPTGYILFFMYFVVRIEKTAKNLRSYFLVLFIVGLFFEQIMLLFASWISPFVPTLAWKILDYFGESGVEVQDGIAISFIKGVPYYFIACLGLFYRKIGKKCIKHYDEYLIVVGTGAFLFLISLYSAWLSRFVFFFGYTSFVFFGQLMKITWKRINRMACKFVVGGSLLVLTYRFLYLVYSLYGGF
ncbi:MAG: EpsG family protein [Lachnospiraceae bacterium]|nr:EpsG family protein [Lachnospiraceae bacterium]